MNVGYTCQLLPNGPGFGVAGCILQLARSLVRTRGTDRLTLYAHDPLPDLAAAGDGHRVMLSSRLNRLRLARIIWEQVRLPVHARNDGVDLLHAPGYVMPIAGSLPTVLTVYDLIALEHPALVKPSNGLHYGALLAASVRNARHLIVPSAAVLAGVLARFAIDAARVSVIAPGVADRFRATPTTEELRAVRERYRLPARFILFAGSFEPKKNLPRLIDAYTLARERGDVDGDLLLVGGGGWGGVLAGRRQTRGVCVLDYLPATDLPTVYRLARVVALPSLVEGFGLPVVEAMASGIPVVCAEVPGLAEADPAAAVVVDPLSIESIADGLARAWNDSDLRADLVARGQRAAARLTWDAAARATWDVYRRVLGSEATARQ